MFSMRDQGNIREREILRVAGETTCGNLKSTTVAVRNEVMKWATNQVSYTLPNEAWKGLSFESLRGGRNCICSAYEDDTSLFWAVRVEKPDVIMAQRIWTTEIVTGYDKKSNNVMISLRLLVSTPEGYLDISPAVPGVIRQVTEKCGFKCGISDFGNGPSFITTEDETEELVRYLVNPARKTPVFVCSIADWEDKPRIDVEALSMATIGIGHVVVITSECSWVLTNILGNRLSTYNGAVRAYLQGFSYNANPYAHRCYVPSGPYSHDWDKQTARRLRWLAASKSIRHLKFGVEVLSFASVRDYAFDLARANLKQSGTTEATQLVTALGQIAALKDDLKRSEDETAQWLEAFESAEELALKLDQRLRAAEFRIQQLVDQIKKRGDSPDGNVEYPTSWDRFAEWCDETLNGRVELSGRARREVRNPVYGEPAVAAQCLLWLANDYRDARLSGSDGHLCVPILSGIKNDRCGAEAFPFDWDGQTHEVEWHIKNGGNTRDPRRCLRVYYFWDDIGQRVVIASMPAHVTTEAS